jgi:S1-C subfamily serine protease
MKPFATTALFFTSSNQSQAQSSGGATAQEQQFVEVIKRSISAVVYIEVQDATGTTTTKGSGFMNYVTPGSPAAKAGLQAGDIIVALDGRLIKGKNFETAVADLKPGTQILVNYARGSLTHEVSITVGSKN